MRELSLVLLRADRDAPDKSSWQYWTQDFCSVNRQWIHLHVHHHDCALREVGEWVYQHRHLGGLLFFIINDVLQRPKWACLSDVGSIHGCVLGSRHIQSNAGIWQEEKGTQTSMNKRMSQVHVRPLRDVLLVSSWPARRHTLPLCSSAPGCMWISANQHCSYGCEEGAKKKNNPIRPGQSQTPSESHLVPFTLMQIFIWIHTWLNLTRATQSWMALDAKW